MTKTTGGLFNTQWLSEEAAIEEAARISQNFSDRFRFVRDTMVLRGENGFLTLQGNTKVGGEIQWDGLDLVVVSRFAMGRKIA